MGKQVDGYMIVKSNRQKYNLLSLKTIYKERGKLESGLDLETVTVDDYLKDSAARVLLGHNCTTSNAERAKLNDCLKSIEAKIVLKGCYPL